MLRVESARWGQTPADLRELAMSAPHPRTRERFLALYEITQESCATRIAECTHRHPQTVLEWLHLYNTGGPYPFTSPRQAGSGMETWGRLLRALASRLVMYCHGSMPRRRQVSTTLRVAA